MSSSRIPGTCQSKPSGRSCASRASGHDGRDAVVGRLPARSGRRARAPGRPGATGPGSRARRRALHRRAGRPRVMSSSRGVRLEASRHQASNERTSNTSRGIRACVEARTPPHRRRGCRGGARAPRSSRAGAAARGCAARRRSVACRGRSDPNRPRRGRAAGTAREPTAGRSARAGHDAAARSRLRTASPSHRRMPRRPSLDQCGSLSWRLARSPASDSAHAGIDGGDRAREQSRGLHELGGHHGRADASCAVRNLGRSRTALRARRCIRPRAGAWTAAAAALGGRPRRGALVEDADVRQESRQDRLVDGVRVGVALRPLFSVRGAPMSMRSCRCTSTHSRTRT